MARCQGARPQAAGELRQSNNRNECNLDLLLLKRGQCVHAVLD